MKFRYRVRPNPKGKAAWKDSSSLVLTGAGLAITTWLGMDKDQKLAVLASLGVSPYHLAIATLIAVVAAGLIAKHTSIQRMPPVEEPVQHQEDPDHGA